MVSEAYGRGFSGRPATLTPSARLLVADVRERRFSAVSAFVVPGPLRRSSGHPSSSGSGKRRLHP